MLRNAVVEVKDVPVFYLPMLYYPIQEDDRATGFLMPHVRLVARDGIVDQQRVLLGDQPQPGRHVLPRLDVLARQRPRRRVPLHARAAGAGQLPLLLARREGSDRSTAHRAMRGRARRSRAASARTCRSACRRAPASTTSPTSRCSRPTTTTSTQASNSNRTIDGGISGSWRNLSVNAHVPAHRNVLQRGRFDGERARRPASPRR